MFLTIIHVDMDCRGVKKKKQVMLTKVHELNLG